MSRPRPGAASVRAGHDEARESLDLAARLDLVERVVDAGDLTVHRLLLRDRPAAHDLVRSVLVPLEGARGGAEPLVATLETWFATGCVATEAAARMHLSVRAVTYRLARVADLTGHDPADPADRFTLQTAVAVARLLGWPAVRSAPDGSPSSRGLPPPGEAPPRERGGHHVHEAREKEPIARCRSSATRRRRSRPVADAAGDACRQ